MQTDLCYGIYLLIVESLPPNKLRYLINLFYKLPAGIFIYCMIVEKCFCQNIDNIEKLTVQTDYVCLIVKMFAYQYSWSSLIKSL